MIVSIPDIARHKLIPIFLLFFVSAFTLTILVYVFHNTIEVKMLNPNPDTFNKYNAFIDALNI